jgi:hypothetical protein
MTDVENRSQAGPPGMKRGGPDSWIADGRYRLSRLACAASRCFVRLRILLLRLDICPPLVAPQILGLV